MAEEVQKPEKKKDIATAYARWKDLLTEKIQSSDAQVASVLLER